MFINLASLQFNLSRCMQATCKLYAYLLGSRQMKDILTTIKLLSNEMIKSESVSLYDLVHLLHQLYETLYCFLH